MALRLGSTVVDVAGIELMTAFWSQALGLVPSSTDVDDDLRVLLDPEGNEFCVCLVHDG